MSIHHTMSGVCINTDDLVIDHHDEVIPNLYVVGGVAGDTQGYLCLSSNAICDIFTFGRMTDLLFDKL